MSRRIEKDGRFYRMRRGKLVEIPPEWVGEVPHPESIRKRDSKGPRKDRMRVDNPFWDPKYGGKPGHPRHWAPRHGGLGRRAREEASG